MLAGGIWWDDRLGAAFAEPPAQLASIIGSIGEKALRMRDGIQERAGRDKVMSIASCNLQNERPAAVVSQGMDFGRAAPARAADGVTEGPPFPPAAERCALT